MSNGAAGSTTLSLAGTPPAYRWDITAGLLVSRSGSALYSGRYLHFFPYFSNVVVGDPIAGQALVGYVNTVAGVVMALTVPFLGAIADKAGRLKPWLSVSIAVVAACAFSLWWVTPDYNGLGLYPILGILILMNVAFAYAEVFHNAMLPRVAPVDKAGVISGLAYALGNFGGLSLMLLVLLGLRCPAPYL